MLVFDDQVLYSQWVAPVSLFAFEEFCNEIPNSLFAAEINSGSSRPGVLLGAVISWSLVAAPVANSFALRVNPFALSKLSGCAD